MDQMLCKNSIFRSGDYNVQNSRTGWIALVEVLTRNGIYKLYEMISNLDQYNVVNLLLKSISYLELWRLSWLAERNHLTLFYFLGTLLYNFHFFLISNIFINNVDFAIQIFQIKNIGLRLNVLAIC